MFQAKATVNGVTGLFWLSGYTVLSNCLEVAKLSYINSKGKQTLIMAKDGELWQAIA